MSIFGWSYPPGCSGPPDEDYCCEICYRNTELCECPECPVCGEIGNLKCEEHGLDLSKQKQIGQSFLDNQSYIEPEIYYEEDHF